MTRSANGREAHGGQEGSGLAAERRAIHTACVLGVRSPCCPGQIPAGHDSVQLGPHPYTHVAVLSPRSVTRPLKSGETAREMLFSRSAGLPLAIYSASRCTAVASAAR